MFETLLISIRGEKVIGTFPTFREACASALSQWTVRNVVVVSNAETGERWSYSEMKLELAK